MIQNAVMPRLPRLYSEQGLRSAKDNDDQLMALVAADHQGAFSTIVERYQDRVRRVCTVLLRGDASAGRDAAQEVFLTLWATRARYRPEGKLKSLLFTIARNHCRKTTRRQRLVSWLGFDDLALDESMADPRDMHKIVADAQLKQLLMAHVHELPDKFRLPLMLRFQEGLDYDDIATVIDSPSSSARSRVHYALKKLIQRLPAEVAP